LRKNMHYVMCILTEIYEAGFEEFLTTYLHPEYAAYDYNFTKFDVATGDFEAEEFPVDNLNTRKQAKRYVRISFESLREYAEKDNRNSSRWSDKKADLLLAKVLVHLREESFTQAREEIDGLLAHLAKGLIADF
jgi:Type II restriction endonuclease (RE_Alw26IDE)